MIGKKEVVLGHLLLIFLLFPQYFSGFITFGNPFFLFFFFSFFAYDRHLKVILAERTRYTGSKVREPAVIRRTENLNGI